MSESIHLLCSETTTHPTIKGTSERIQLNYALTKDRTLGAVKITLSMLKKKKNLTKKVFF